MRKVVELTRADGSVVCEQCLVADSPLARMRGLLGREELPRGEGMLLRPAASVHTALMRFAIDVVFVSETGRVLKVVHSVPPCGSATTAACTARNQAATDAADHD